MNIVDLMQRTLIILLLAYPASTLAKSLDQPPVTLQLTYEGYVEGCWFCFLPIMYSTIVITLNGDGYTTETIGRTSVIVDLFKHADWYRRDFGAWSGGTAAPSNFEYSLTIDGTTRHVQLGYVGGSAVVQVRRPEDDGDHEPVVPSAGPPGAIDPDSILPMVMHQIATNGTCTGYLTTFDGRSVEELGLHPASTDTLRWTHGSLTADHLKRCDIDGRMTSGFDRHDMPTSKKPYVDSILIGSILKRPDLPPVPVQMTMTKPVLHKVELYLTTVTSLPGAIAAAKLRASGH